MVNKVVFITVADLLITVMIVTVLRCKHGTIHHIDLYRSHRSLRLMKPIKPFENTMPYLNFTSQSIKLLNGIYGQLMPTMIWRWRW
uniref:Putative secreted protein n=1 Tax=Anopheles darlingi TaxID=43151 RepID=A0A2M4DQY7_ANODA